MASTSGAAPTTIVGSGTRKTKKRARKQDLDEDYEEVISNITAPAKKQQLKLPSSDDFQLVEPTHFVGLTITPAVARATYTVLARRGNEVQIKCSAKYDLHYDADEPLTLHIGGMRIALKRGSYCTGVRGTVIHQTNAGVTFGSSSSSSMIEISTGSATMTFNSF